MSGLKAISSWDGDTEAIGVEDINGGIWWPNTETQAAIQASDDQQAEAVRICDTEPMRGEWKF